MASRRPGPQTFGWSGTAGPRGARGAPEAPRDGVDLRGRWKAREGDEGGHQPARTIPQPGPSSRLPQAPSHRRPSDGQPERPQLVQQKRPLRTSTGSASGGVTSDTDGMPSSAPTTARLPAPSLKPRNILRRKRSGLSQDAAGPRVVDTRNDSAGTSSSDSGPRSQTPSDPLHLDRELTQSPMEIRVAQQVEIPMTKAQTVTIYPELDRYRDYKPTTRPESSESNVPFRLATHDLPPPTPLFSGTSSQLSAFSGSPSTRWSESPGPGPYSRDTTPTSISSQSPGLVAPIRIPPPGARTRQLDQNPTRPPVTRRRTGSISNEGLPPTADPHGLAVVRELSTSSSSNSTVRAGANSAGLRKKKKKGVPEQPPPSPPPRTSSQKPRENRHEPVLPLSPPGEAAQAVSSPPKVTSYSRPRPVQGGQTATSQKPKPPVRPSREGIVDLHSQLGQSIPVVQSNLSSTSLSERRQSGLVVPGLVPRSAFSSSSLAERPGPPSAHPPAREPTQAPKPATLGDPSRIPKQETVRPTRTPSPSVSTFRTRFPLFGRRAKTVPEPSQTEKKERPPRKGPAAGTGHEGYGRLGSVRRRSSSITNPSRVIPGTMSSQESLSSSLTHDTFLAERMAPVIIAGGEVIENRNTSSELTRTESNQSASLRRPSIDSRNSSQVSLSAREAPRTALWPSPFPRGVTQTPSLSSRRPSESSDSDILVTKPTLALRRSMQRIKTGEQEPPRLPKPIVTGPKVVSPSMTSLDGGIMSDDSVVGPCAEPAVAAKEPASVPLHPGRKKLTRRPRSPRKWNFFGRSHNPPTVEKKPDTAKTVAATVQVVQSKPKAFYTIMDSSEQEDADPVDLEEVLREARGIAVSTPEPAPVVKSERRRPSETEHAAQSVATQAQQDEQQQPFKSKQPGTVPVSSVSEMKHVPAPAQQPERQAIAPRQGQGRPSRLPQVGRIPKVVSAARAEHISPKSFSRPFHRLSVQAPPVQVDPQQDEDSVAKGPSPPEPSSPEPLYNGVPADESNISALIYGFPRLPPPIAGQPGLEFLSFSPRKDSQCTTTTSSSSSGGLLSYADSTAIVPEPNAPLAEDEIWDEYNDLLGDDTIKLPVSNGPAWPKPLRLEGHANGILVEPPMESPTISPPPLPSLVQALRSGMEHPSLSVRGSDVAEEVKRLLDCEPTPGTPVLALDSSSSRDDRAHIHVNLGRQVEPPAATHRNSVSSAQQTRRSDASGSSQGSEDSSPLSQVNLRVGSMTVSKWLTFGHVLFSPIRDELVSDVGSLKRPSILVVDGLGNDDWSFYAAETYPAATFFNLSPRAPLAAEHRSESSFPLSPPNHHQVQYQSHTAKFPFGAQSFTAVVFRFPAAAPEGHYRNIISEARRVLKPGGYIELSILDVDLNNMGNRCRRTVRRLKERIHARAPETSLAPASDLILRLIGRRGFTDIKTCRVGVPVASMITRSSSSEASMSANTSSTGAAASREKRKDERSLPEMINDEGPVADESIAKSVAKVGRWWYNRCYESVAAPGVGPSSRASIWHDKALLAECEQWGTSLKLMVCHARAPDGRARVASV